MFLKATGLGKLRQGDWAVRNVSFELQAFRKLAIAGETGSGKSSLLQMLAGIINPDEGVVYFEGERVKKVPEEKLLPGHPGIAYLSQQFELPHNVRVEEVLAYSNEWEDKEAQHLYKICEVDHLLKRRTDQLSGGERQRIALARLLGSSPRLLLLDEPFSNLDPIHKNTLKNVIENIADKLSMTVVLVSHDPLDTIGWADEIIILHHGRIVQRDIPERIFYQPVDEYTAGLFGKYNLLSRETLKLLSPLQTISDSARLMIRPNELSVSKSSESGIEGTITAVKFSGMLYELSVEVNNQILYVSNLYADWQIGQKVYVSLSRKE